MTNSNHTVEETVVAIQADRDAAADMIVGYWLGGGNEKMHELAARIRSGHCDHMIFVQTLARHRLEAVSSQGGEAHRFRGALEGIANMESGKLMAKVARATLASHSTPAGDFGDLVGRLRDDAGLSKERSVACRKIGDAEGASVASQIADDLDEAAYALSRVTPAGEDVERRHRLCLLIEAKCPSRGDHGIPIGTEVEQLADAILAALPPSTHDELVDAGDVGSLRYVLNFADTNTRVSTVMKTFTLPDRMTTKDRLERLWAALTKMGEKL